MANRSRSYRLSVYLDENEKYILDNKVKISGAKSKGAFLRTLITYGYVYDVDYKYLREYSTELNRIGTLLNQIAKRVNTSGNIYKTDMEEVKELMEKIWRTQESMLSKQPLISR
jgi:nitrous oxidase accessory protein NosD